MSSHGCLPGRDHYSSPPTDRLRATRSHMTDELRSVRIEIGSKNVSLDLASFDRFHENLALRSRNDDRSCAADTARDNRAGFICHGSGGPPASHRAWGFEERCAPPRFDVLILSFLRRCRRKKTKQLDDDGRRAGTAGA